MIPFECIVCGLLSADSYVDCPTCGATPAVMGIFEKTQARINWYDQMLWKAEQMLPSASANWTTFVTEWLYERRKGPPKP